MYWLRLAVLHLVLQHDRHGGGSAAHDDRGSLYRVPQPATFTELESVLVLERQDYWLTKPAGSSKRWPSRACNRRPC